jgi:ankyrin repeat protein
MSGFVVREGVRLQAAAAARIAGKSGIGAAATSGDVADVLSYLITHANCLNELYSYSSHKTWIRNPERCTALYFAADSGCIEVCQLLIEAKSDVNATAECASMFKICC